MDAQGRGEGRAVAGAPWAVWGGGGSGPWRFSRPAAGCSGGRGHARGSLPLNSRTPHFSTVNIFHPSTYILIHFSGESWDGAIQSWPGSPVFNASHTKVVGWLGPGGGGASRLPPHSRPCHPCTFFNAPHTSYSTGDLWQRAVGRVAGLNFHAAVPLPQAKISCFNAYIALPSPHNPITVLGYGCQLGTWQPQ